ncbi:MAG: protein-export chaperone SecB [Alphaproteobacteria bacterium]
MMSDDQAKNQENNQEQANPAPDNAQENAQKNAPPFQFLIQYLKDVSFESPGAPDIFKKSPQVAPKFDIDVNTKSLGGRDIEVIVNIDVKGQIVEAQPKGSEPPFKITDELAYIAELSQCAVIRINNMPKEAIASVVMVEVPTLLYPFLRHATINLIRDGGFPPPQLPLINFLNLARNKNEQAKQAQDAEKQAAEK